MLDQKGIPKKKRIFYPDNFNPNRWKVIKKAFISLLNIPIDSVNDLEHLIHKSSEGIQILFDYRNKLFIKMKSKTTIWNYLKFFWFQKKIITKGLYYNHQWESKIDESPFKDQSDQSRYGHLFKIIAHQKKFFVSHNIALQGQEEGLANRYGLISSRLRGQFNGKQCTLAELDRKLASEDRDIRKQAFFEISRIYLNYSPKLQGLLDQLLNIRHSIALNTGYRNYRDYAHDAKGRFSYGIGDVLQFHEVIEKEVVPLLHLINAQTKKTHALEDLKPWDIRIGNVVRSIPYKDKHDLLEKCTKVMSDIKAEYGVHFKELVDADLLDIFNRKKKSPGSYNIPIFERRASFILANFVEEKADYLDISLLHHEFGHALHHYFTIDEPIMGYRNFPSEISELAAMTMELLSIEHLHFYYPDSESRLEAKRQQFRRFLQVIISRCLGDAFQHWIYTHPGHRETERNDIYIELMKRFSEGISWEGIAEYQSLESLKVLHFFQTPFYYIEYAFAALGAIDLYKKYKENKTETLDNYERFLKSGYNKDIHLLYKEAGTSFNFSQEKVHELMTFVRQELNMS